MKLPRILSLTSSFLIANALAGAVNAADLSKVPSGKYAVDPTHAFINFQYSHLGLSNPNISFDDFTMDLTLDNEDPTNSTVAITIDANSVLAGSPIFKEHLTGDKFFDSANHPEITFNSTGIEAAGGDNYKVTGDLTIKGITKPTTLMVTINNAMMHPMAGKPVIGIGATGELMRSDWGLGLYAPNISDAVSLNITAELLQ